MRFFLLDKITEYEPKKSAKGLKCITLSDPVLHDHFPGLPLLPGALIMEGVAQLGGWLLETIFNRDEKNLYRSLFIQADKIKFHAKSGPGDVLEYSVHVKQLLDEAGKIEFQAHSKLSGEKKASGILTFHMADAKDEKAINEQRIYLYKIWTKDLENCPPIR